MNLSQDFTSTLEFLAELRAHALSSTQRELFIDQSHLESISPAAALLLAAEVKRCFSMSPSGKRFRGNYPANRDAAAALVDIGFYEHLQIAANLPERSSNRLIKVVSGRESDGRHAHKLIQQFQRSLPMTVLAQKRLYGALVECMDNVHAHAYDSASRSPDLLGEWWMAGHTDPDAESVAFLFFDQGQGIPTTLRSKIDKSLIQAAYWPPEQMLEQAVMIGVSRKGDVRHGKGLPSLREFIDELPYDGYLHVMSKSAAFRYESDKSNSRAPLASSVEGTLIAWSVRVPKADLHLVEITDQPIAPWVR